jgi:hypothetical protein
MAKTGADLTAPKGSSEGDHKHEEHKKSFPDSLILGIHCVFCVIMVLLLRKNLVNRNVRLVFLAVILVIFGILFKAQTEPMRGFIQFFQSL